MEDPPSPIVIGDLPNNPNIISINPIQDIS
jgi:hypothetical protein